MLQVEQWQASGRQKLHAVLQLVLRGPTVMNPPGSETPPAACLLDCECVSMGNVGYKLEVFAVQTVWIEVRDSARVHSRTLNPAPCWGGVMVTLVWWGCCEVPGEYYAIIG